MRGFGLFVFAVLWGLTASAGAHAAPVVCVRDQDERRVEVVSLDPEAGGACEVRYARKGAAPQTLWKSAWRADFCLEKSVALIGRLVEQGFQCQEAP